MYLVQCDGNHYQNLRSGNFGMIKSNAANYADCEKETKAPVITLTKGEEKLKVGALISHD